MVFIRSRVIVGFAHRKWDLMKKFKKGSHKSTSKPAPLMLLLLL